MYTIRQAARLTGIPEGSLRAWERRYGVVVPRRTPAGYRVYDDEAVSLLATMRRLVDEGWAPAQAAQAVRSGDIATARAVERGEPQPASLPDPDRLAATEVFLTAAAALDPVRLEESLDRAWALGSLERVVETWLFPTLRALGEGWARGDIDVAGEHTASHAVHRRLSAAFEAAASRTRGPRVVVGLPPGSRHELGALAFAAVSRRLGHDVMYLGADVPSSSWLTAVEGHRARAAVLAVPTDADRPAAAEVVAALLEAAPQLLVATGGAAGTEVAPGAHTLQESISAAARHLDEVLFGEAA